MFKTSNDCLVSDCYISSAEEQIHDGKYGNSLSYGTLEFGGSLQAP
jgi:hypothetical protein